MQGQSLLMLRRLLPQAGGHLGLAKPGFAFSSLSTGSDTAVHGHYNDISKQQQAQPQLQGPPQVCASSIRPQTLHTANLLSCAGALSPKHPSFAASPAMQQQVRALSTLASRRRTGLPLLPGRASPGALSAPNVQGRRTYLTEGEVFGTVYQFTTNMMFWAGIVGAAAFRRNLIVLLLSSEIVMLACNMNFLFASAYLNDITGVIMSITITTIAACETAIGLALCVAYFHMRSAIDVEALNLLK